MKKIAVTKSSMPSYEEYCLEIKKLWETRWLTNMGEKHNQLQEELIKFLEVDNLELMVNGHMALELSLQSLNISGEVITTPFTFASTTHAIVRNRLEPVFCDINPYDYTLDVDKIEKCITDRTSAIMPVHVYGNICDIKSIEEIARKYDLKVIYDAAHTFGEKYQGVGVGNFGDISCFSFHATKVFNTIEGGAVCFRNNEIGQKLVRLRDFGIKDEENVDIVGSNAKMNEFCAAMGICNLIHIEQEIDKRRKVVNRYRERLENIEGIQLNQIQKNVTSNYAYFPVLFDEKKFGNTRTYVRDKLLKNGINARKYFYPLTNSFDAFGGRYDVNDTPIALYISKRILALPLYAELCLEDVDNICDIIISCKI